MDYYLSYMRSSKNTSTRLADRKSAASSRELQRKSSYCKDSIPAITQEQVNAAICIWMEREGGFTRYFSNPMLQRLWDSPKDRHMIEKAIQRHILLRMGM